MSQRPTLQRLIGVYDADATLWGEVSYWVGARLGRAHCALCDITHGLVRPKAEWEACRAALPVAFDTYHRDDQPDDVRAAARGTAPIVAADTDTGIVLLLDRQALDELSGSVEALVAAVERRVGELGIDWPA